MPNFALYSTVLVPAVPVGSKKERKIKEKEKSYAGENNIFHEKKKKKESAPVLTLYGND
jgi:hypothetical protein